MTKTVTTFVLEDNVPMPETKRTRTGMLDATLANMKEGNSFFWRDAKKANAYNVVRAWAIKQQKETGGERIKFFVQDVNQNGVVGVRVWRKRNDEA